MTLEQAYRAARAPHAFPHGVYQERASHALTTARTRLAWKQADGVVRDAWDTGPCPGRVRLVLKPDDEPSHALDGDFSERVLAELTERANRDGAEWVEVDSCWGFIGDDWRDSGYDIDIMRATLDALAKHDAAVALAIEAERPDMYA